MIKPCTGFPVYYGMERTPDYRRAASNVLGLYFWTATLVVLYIPYSLKLAYQYCKTHYSQYREVEIN